MSDDKNLPEILDIEFEAVPVDDKTPASNVSQVSSHSQSGVVPSQVSQVGGPPSSPSSVSKPHEVDPFLGMRLKGTYELVKKIGEGGMGNVYSAIQYPLERKVAVKVLKPSETNPEGEHYFMREVQAINMLRHPNIITIVDYGKEDSGLLYLVMEHLPGDTLKGVIKKDFPLDPKRMCNILIQILSALEQAHSSGIVHCDLKPANLMVEEVAGQQDFVKVLDFGIAKVKGPAMEVGPYTQAGNIVGTFDYMSPEQIMRKDLDGRADIWSMGVIMYEMLTRKRIFHDKDAVSIIGRVMQMVIRPPSEVVKEKGIEVHPAVEAIVLKAMERNINKRFQSAAEMREALQDAVKQIENPQAYQNQGHRGHQGHQDSGSHSGSLASSGLIKGGTGNLGRAGTSDTGRTGLSSIYTRSGSFGLGDSQRMATGIAAGTSVLDQTFSVDELEGSLKGERRKVAVLSVQQRARRGKGIDPEEMARRSAQEGAVIKEIVAHFEGEVDSNLGGTYTILFGARKARVGDNLRAVQCALALQKRFMAQEQGAAHIGIGLVYGEVFIANRKGGNAYGEAIDRSVDIARAVRDGKVFVDESLIELTRQQVQYDSPRNISGENAAEVLQLDPGAVIGDKNDDNELEDVDVYVPRPGYFDELSRRASEAKSGNGGGVAILGDLGTGKSVLLERFVEDRSKSGWQTFVVREADQQSGRSLAPVRRWICQIAQTYKDPATLVRKACQAIGLQKNLDAVIQLYLGDEKDAPSAKELPWNDAKSFAHFTSALLNRLIRFALKKSPVLLAVDDFDVQDRTGVEFIDNLLSGIQKQPVLVLVTQRIESTALDHGLPGNFEILQIGGFSDNESRQFIAQTLGYTPPPEVVGQMHMRSSGNPMFLFELVRAVRKKGGVRLTDESQLVEAGIPLSLQELLAERIDALPDHLRDLLAVASVLGESFREDFYFQITPTHLDPQNGLADMLALNIMEGRYDNMDRIQIAFNPRALRRVVYDRLPKSTRTQIHSGIIEFLEQSAEFAAVDPLDYPLMLAFHYRSVDGFEGAAYYTVKAGEILLDLYDYAGAIDHLESAVALLKEQNVAPNHESLTLAQSKMLVALRESGRLEDAQRIIDGLPNLETINEPLRSQLRYEVGLIGMEAGSIETSMNALVEVKKWAEEQGDKKFEIKALIALAQLFEKQNQLPKAAGLLMEVSKKVAEVGDLDLQDPDDRKLFWTAYNQLGTLFIRQKDFQRAQQFLNTALQQAREIDDFRGLVRVLSNLGALCLSVRDVSRAMEYFKNAVQFAQGTGDLLNQSRILTNMGITALESNDLDGSKVYFKQARSLAEEIGWYEGLAELSLHIKRLQKAMQ